MLQRKEAKKKAIKNVFNLIGSLRASLLGQIQYVLACLFCQLKMRIKGESAEYG